MHPKPIKVQERSDINYYRNLELKEAIRLRILIILMIDLYLINYLKHGMDHPEYWFNHLPYHHVLGLGPLLPSCTVAPSSSPLTFYTWLLGWVGRPPFHIYFFLGRTTIELSKPTPSYLPFSWNHYLEQQHLLERIIRSDQPPITPPPFIEEHPTFTLTPLTADYGTPHVEPTSHIMF